MNMKIAVCIKVTEGELNPFDEAALECALQTGGEITAVSMCPKSAEPALLRLTRLGVRAILLSDPVFAGSDTLATGYILSCALKKLRPDLILCGRQSIDGDTAQVGPCLSALLDIPVITNVMELPVIGNLVRCKTRLGDCEAELPCLLTIERICRLRFPKLGSRAGRVEVWNRGMIGAAADRCGLLGSPTAVLRVFENQKGRRKCEFISRSELMPLLARLSASQRTEKAYVQPMTPMEEVWTIGEMKEAEAIAKRVVVIPRTSPREIAALAREKQPEAILWSADLWGRKNAPIAAALLETGLCAECTALETDGKRLYMYRPARSGSVTAKIICRTKPQMATVRTEGESGALVVAAGRGVLGVLEKVKSFADALGAELCASRGLVDLGAMPYSAQVGLTGRSVSPGIYIAVGISGAVHHTCAIENAGTVIAINPDPNARIFDYADYGITEKFEIWQDRCHQFQNTSLI